MTSKNQVTIPIKVVNALGLEKGCLFSVDINKSRIELIPLEPVEKVFTKKEYAALDKLSKKQKGTEKRVTKRMVSKLKKGKI